MEKQYKVLFLIAAILFLNLKTSTALDIPSGIMPLSGNTGSTEDNQATKIDAADALINQFAQFKEYIDVFQEENAAFIDVLINEKYQLPYDNITVGSSAAEYNNPTSIGLWLVYLIDIFKGDIETDRITARDALARLNTALDSIIAMPKWNGLLGWSSISDSGIRKTGEASAFDNANFAASLAVVWGALTSDTGRGIPNPLLPTVLGKVTKLLFIDQKEGWENLYDQGRGLIWGDENKRYPIDILYTEGRLAPLMAIALSDIDEEVWNNLTPVYRTYKMSNGQQAELIVPYQGAFQAYLPLLFVPEDAWSPDMAIAHQNYAAVQVDYANETNLPALRSAASNPYYEAYVYNPELGVPGASQVSVTGDIGTVHANALLSLVAPDSAVALLKALDEFTKGEIHGPYGMRDSVGLHGEVSNTYLSLDHLIMVTAMAGKVNQEYFVNFLKATGKLEKIKALYSNLNLDLDPVAIPEVKEFFVASLPEDEEELPQTGSLIDFDQGNGRKGEHVPAFGVWDGPSGKINERVSGGVMEINYDTPEYNGLWLKLNDLDPIGEYKELIFDIKAEKGFQELKIELKKSGNVLGSYVIENIAKNDWITVRIPIPDFGMSANDLKKALEELVFVIEGWKLPSSQRKGIFYLDNIRLDK